MSTASARVSVGIVPNEDSAQPPQSSHRSAHPNNQENPHHRRIALAYCAARVEHRNGRLHVSSSVRNIIEWQSGWSCVTAQQLSTS